MSAQDSPVGSKRASEAHEGEPDVKRARSSASECQWCAGMSLVSAQPESPEGYYPKDGYTGPLAWVAVFGSEEEARHALRRKMIELDLRYGLHIIDSIDGPLDAKERATIIAAARSRYDEAKTYEAARKVFDAKMCEIDTNANKPYFVPFLRQV